MLSLYRLHTKRCSAGRDRLVRTYRKCRIHVEGNVATSSSEKRSDIEMAARPAARYGSRNATVVGAAAEEIFARADCAR